MISAPRLTSLLTISALLGIAAPAAAVPLPGQTGGFGITPARRAVVGQPGTSLTPTTVFNGTSSSYRVTVVPVILYQDFSGAFDFSETPRNLNDSKLVLSTSPDGFLLAPGDKREVDLRWNLLPQGQPSVAMGVVFQGIAQGQSGPVHVITRLLGVNFLRLPSASRIDGLFTALYPEQFSPRVLRFLARVKNTGNRFWAPTDGQLVIRGSSGHTVLSTGWAGDVVLPGAQVDSPITVNKVLPAGHYTATVSMRFGGKRSRSTTFTLVGPNQLPTPAITIKDFNATGVVGSPAHLTARILSSGTAPAGVTLHLYLGTVNQAPGANALATAQASYRDLAPGSATHLSRPLGSLSKGSYRVIATWTDRTGAQHTAESEFTAIVTPSRLDQAWSFIKNHALLLAGLLVLVLLLAMGYLVQRLRHRQQRLVAELAAARARIEAARIDGGANGHIHSSRTETPTPESSP